MYKCDYKNCNREMISGDNILFDINGEEYSVDICGFHLKKLVPEAVIKENGGE